MCDVETENRRKEFEALRSEVVARMHMRHNVTTVTVIVAGTFLGLGAAEKLSVEALLIYPLIALGLAFIWMHSDMRISELGRYIRDNLEPHLPGMGWQKYKDKLRHPEQEDHKEKSEEERAPGRMNPLVRYAIAIAASCLFVITQILAIVLAATMFPLSVFHWIGLVVDAVAVLLTLWILNLRRNEYC